MPLSRRDFIKAGASAGVAAGILPLQSALPSDAPTPERPNILFIMTDQEPTSTIGCYGNDKIKTPARDAIADGGIRFANFYIASFPCSPSRATMMTGRYAHHHGVVQNEILLKESIPSLGNTLRKAGYATAYIGKWHLGGGTYRGVRTRPFKGRYHLKRKDSPDGFEFERVEGGTGEDEPRSGFDHWVGGWKHFKAYLRTTDLPPKFKNHEWAGNHNALPSADDSQHAYSQLGEKHHMAHFFADEAVKFLNNTKTSPKPFCMVLSFFAPHLPVCPPKPWDTMYSLADIELPANHAASLEAKPFGQRIGDRTFVRPRWTAEQFKDYIRRYWGYVSYVDRQMERVLAALKANGQDENTIVVFTSDHGDMIGQHGSIYKLTRNGYDTLMKVPCMIRWPRGIPSGKVSSSLASNVDLMPTLLALADVPVPDGVDGKSMKDVLMGRQTAARDEIFTDVMDRGVMMRRSQWKFVLNWPRFHPSGRDRDELYNLADDPHETKNLAYVESHKKTADQMRRRILEWLEQTRHPYADVIRKAAAQPVAVPFKVRPRLSEFEDLGDGRFKISFVFKTAQKLPQLAAAQCMVQLSRKRGARTLTPWRSTMKLEPSPDQWQPQREYSFSMDGAVKKGTAKGTYTLRLGLKHPKIKGGVLLATGHKNVMPVADVRIERVGQNITLSAVSHKET